MTAGTVVITGGILATIILLCIIAVLCYCRLQVRPGGQHNTAHIAALFALSCLCFALLYAFLSCSTATFAFVGIML